MQQTHCAGCSTQFTFTTLKHQCRSCSDSFCHACSSGRRPVPEKGFKEAVRVCDLCLHAVDRRTRLVGKSSVKDSSNQQQNEAHLLAMDRLKRIYKAKIRPLEQAYRFSEFYSTELTDGDFDAKPFVLLIGGYSVGKTSFIQYMLKRNFPGCRIGPEPTTDRFLAIMISKPGAQDDIVIPGNAGAIDIDRPFTSLNRFGTNFLSRFEICELQSSILNQINFIDTPGILSGEKQRMDRGYSFEHVISWFAERADRILLLFDGNKLDISDELKRVIEMLKAHDEKIRIVLNKADLIDSQQLMRVYGALMWSLGKVIKTPEVLRVYIGSYLLNHQFNSISSSNHHLFSQEHEDLLSDLYKLPQQSAVRKINELVKRARLARVHALLINHLRNNMPWIWGHKKKQQRLALRLEEEYVKVQKAHPYVALGDFPSAELFRKGLDAFDLSEFPAISKRLLDVVDGALTRDIPKLMIDIGMTNELQQHQQQQQNIVSNLVIKQIVDSHANATVISSTSKDNPFLSSGQIEWAVSGAAKRKWDSIFHSLKPTGTPASLNGTAVRDVMVQSGLSQDALRKIWDLSDIDSNGLLQEDEFAVAMTLIRRARAEGNDSIPEKLPIDMVPPTRR